MGEPPVGDSFVPPRAVAAVLLVRPEGSILAQLRDDKAPVSPNQWGLVGGARLDGEEPLAGALRELREETGLVPDEPLSMFYSGKRPASRGSGETMWHVFYGRTAATDADIVVGEGRDIRFVPADVLIRSDLGVSAAFFLPLFLASAQYRECLAQS